MHWGLIIYRIAVDIIVGPFCLFAYKDPNFKGTLLKRFSFDMPRVPRDRPVIWVHASSVGEVLAIAPLVARIKKKDPASFILLSSMTLTGRKMASTKTKADKVIPMPFDLGWVMRRYIRRLNISMLIITETEIWPNMLFEARSAFCPVVFVNARMSEKAFSHYKRFRSMFSRVLKGTNILAISSVDAKRFSCLGADRVRVMGNIKVDSLNDTNKEISSGLRQQMGLSNRPVFIAGSIRSGEETYVLDAIKEASGHIPGLYAIVAPRHPDRVDAVCEKARNLGLSCAKKSSKVFDADCLVVDTFGELFDLYGIADAAFVGGSLVETGGQNILESLVWGTPTMHGLYMENFQWAMAMVGDYTIKVPGPKALGPLIVDVFNNLESNRRVADKARETIVQARGVMERYMEAIGSVSGLES
ncbi:MAG: 3-deoxy-D-manno-octulosonic acid transferase [Thermodesulfobacteriota bacterium]|nr:3-deoxy-D-manno-octulosonic acid transferase [Thermodesulfobacteriota bacterium]